MSIHIAAKPGEIAPAVLLPGDPLRAKFIAETFFDRPVRYTETRNMFGYTGTYKGKPISVQGTGMGIPSISIYVNELFKDYGVERAIRVGTAGSLRPEIELRDLVIAMSASTDSAANAVRFRGMDYAPTADFGLLLAAHKAAESRGWKPKVGAVLSSDMFYTEDPDQWKLWAAFGVLAVEMETAELYTLAAKYGRQALSILTISDSLVTHQATSSEERQTTFTKMMEIALDAAIG
jgi:purine-nucleoside phosphorylase